MSKSDITDVRVFISGIEVPDILVENVSCSYEKLPGVGRCTLTLVNVDGVFYQNASFGLSEELRRFRNELIRTLERKYGSRQYMDNVPLIFDSDVVWVFLNLDGKWWWGFFGYINGYSVSYGLGGKETITVTCWDALQPFRYNRLVMHNVIIPTELLNEKRELRKEVKDSIWMNITVMQDLLQGSTFYDKIMTVFGYDKRGEAQKYVEGRWLPFRYMKETERDFSLNIDKLDTNDRKLEWYEKYISIIYDKIRVGDDIALDKLVEEMRKEVEERRGFMQRNLYVVNITGLEGVENLWNLMNFSLRTSSINVSYISGVTGVELLRKTLEGLAFDCYCLPNGDVVIEPYWVGIVRNKESCKQMGRKLFDLDDLFYIDDSRLTSLSMGYSGSDIKNFAVVIANLLGKEIRYIPVGVALFGKLEKHGFREAVGNFFTTNITNENVAKAVCYYELFRSWCMVRSVELSLENVPVVYIPNKPVYLEKLDAVFNVASTSWDINKNKQYKSKMALKGGFFNDGNGNYIFEAFIGEDKALIVGDIVDLFRMAIKDVDKSVVEKE